MEAALTHRQLDTAYGGFHEHEITLERFKYIANYGLWELYVVGADGWVIPLRLTTTKTPALQINYEILRYHQVFNSIV